MNKTSVILTVFTPAFNRAHTLPRTYASLKAQDCYDFEWLIVDDGSSDGTQELVKSWIAENPPFKIRYIYKKNGGMHTAYNTAYDNINTELSVCIDSDDCLSKGAVSRILSKWNEVRSCGYAGLIGLDSDMAGNIIGNGFKPGLKETTLTDYYLAGGTGDKKLVYRTDVVKRYPKYPEFEGEKYVALSYKFTMIDKDYKLAVLDEVLCDVEYQPDGHGAGMWKEYLRSPKGFAFYRKFCMENPTTIKRLIVDCVHYCSSSILAKNKKYILESPRKFLTILCTLPGAVLSLFTKKKAKG